ncbi:Imm27 family immunity protein [Spongiibacter marinus]|uniref:Imm27 family immunity protein n=1 Tax=Spongiibacter marinus TaxID=354246 RepID=UPI0035BE6476
MNRLSSDEQEIVGSWIIESGKIVADENCQRITWLTSSQLSKLATDENGWEVLYQDPFDSRLWVRAYPQGHLHGGGPPLLRCISEATAKEQFSEYS